MTDGTTSMPMRRVLAFDAALAVAALALIGLLAGSLPLWLVVPIALAIVVNALVIATFVRVYVRTARADRAVGYERAPAPTGPLVGIRAR